MVPLARLARTAPGADTVMRIADHRPIREKASPSMNLTSASEIFMPLSLEQSLHVLDNLTWWPETGPGDRG